MTIGLRNNEDINKYIYFLLLAGFGLCTVLAYVKDLIQRHM